MRIALAFGIALGAGRSLLAADPPAVPVSPTPAPVPAAPGLASLPDNAAVQARGTFRWGGERPTFTIEEPEALRSPAILELHEGAALEALIRAREAYLAAGADRVQANVTLALRIHRYQGRSYARLDSPAPASDPAEGLADGADVALEGDLDVTGPRPALRVPEGKLAGKILRLHENEMLERLVEDARPPLGSRPGTPPRFRIAGKIGRYRGEIFLRALYYRRLP